jgi:hypothetical protein
MGARNIILYLTAVLLSVTNADAKGPFGSIHVGNWNGGAYVDDTTGQFTACLASTNYANGFIVSVMVQPDGNWDLGFTHQSWQLRPGEAIPIDLTFDGQATFHVFGKAVAQNTLAVPMPNTSTLISQFRKSKSMSAFAEGGVVGFTLDGTSQLLPSLANCVAVVKQRGLAAAGDFTVKEPAGGPASARPAVGVGAKPDAPQADSAQLWIEALELATNFILKGLLHNPKVLNQAETPAALASFGAAWHSDEAAGEVRIIPPAAGIKGLDVAAAVVAGDARECKGKFASARTTELVDRDVVFRGFSSCEDSAGPRLVYYFIVPRRKGGFVLFSVGSSMNTEEARGVTKDDRLVGFQKAVLVTANQ